MTRRILLRSEPKTYCIDTHRVMPPQETLERVKSVVPEVGITRVADISGLDRVGLPVFSAIRPSAAGGAISVYAGKGTTETEARVSVIMEAVERFSAEVDNFEESLAFESYGRLSANDNAVDPMDLILPGFLSSETKIEWCSSWDLLNDEKVFVPANAVFHPYTPTQGTWQLFRSNTNGLASGNVMEEAIFHGLMEVIERDAISIAESDRSPGLGIEVGPGRVAEIVKMFERQGIRIRLWWLPTDTGVPTVVAASDDEKLRDASLLVMGAGSHSDPEIAALRALTEVAQSRATQIHGAREDTDRESSMRRIGYERMKRLNRHWFAVPSKTIELDTIETSATSTIDGDIRSTLEGLSGVADRVIVSDLTVSGIGVPAVRVIIPGFEVYFLDRERKGRRCKGWRRTTA
ncbi:MAG TPA: YcaO-related McrA-glycine thioamidation protein [Candidatus Acidoferrales bacterium]|nr:YcaO-related McrA-glycine thioamidation protein [Candidatus Acidoferrales bacterium]